MSRHATYQMRGVVVVILSDHRMLGIMAQVGMTT